MIEFKGFPARMNFTPIPNIFFSSLLPQITDLTELKVLLHIFEILYPMKGSLKFVSYSELSKNCNLISSLGESPQDILQKYLGALTQKGVLLALAVNNDAGQEEIYFLNNETNRMAAEKIRKGEIVLPRFKVTRTVSLNPDPTSDIFTLYEQNIGMLTPLIADELKEAEKQYPENWIKEAIKEAADLNKRNWRYIARILEHWSTEGKDDGTHRGYLKKNTDPDKYIKGKYGHMVQR